jgi:hypothetical protein
MRSDRLCQDNSNTLFQHNFLDLTRVNDFKLTNMGETVRTDVLIVGAGPAGYVAISAVIPAKPLTFVG